MLVMIVHVVNVLPAVNHVQCGHMLVTNTRNNSSAYKPGALMVHDIYNLCAYAFFVR